MEYTFISEKRNILTTCWHIEEFKSKLQQIYLSLTFLFHKILSIQAQKTI